MIEIDDLIARLTADAAECNAEWAGSGDILTEAATALAALRTRAETAERELASGYLDALKAIRADRNAATARATAAEARVARLRTALEPFDDALGEDEPYLPDDECVTLKYGPVSDFTLELRHLRAARAALAETAPEPRQDDGEVT